MATATFAGTPPAGPPTTKPPTGPAMTYGATGGGMAFNVPASPYANNQTPASALAPGTPGFSGGAVGTPPGKSVGPLNGPGLGETYGQSHLGGYDTPTALENFANQQLAGDNPYYQRLMQQQNDTINQQMAARGNYNSGGALTALGNADAALNAQQFKDMGDLLGQSSALGLNRLGAGINAAEGIQNQQDNRLQQQFNNEMGISQLASGLYGGFYGQGGAQSGDAAMAGINAGANAASLAGQQTNTQSNYAMQLFKMMMGGGGFGGGGGGGQTNYGNGLMTPTQF